MRILFTRLLGGRLQIVLIASFSLVAAITVGLNALGVLQLIEDYLTDAKDDSVARDMKLAEAFYQIKVNEIKAVGNRMVRDPQVIQNLQTAIIGDPEALAILDQELQRKTTVPTLGGTHLILVLDSEGEIILGRVLSAEGNLSPLFSAGNWRTLPIVATALASVQEQAATEVIPASLLAQVGLESQAFIPLRDTPKAAPIPFHPLEGTAGLAITGVFPLRDNEDHVLGIVLAAYLFNNDFTLVDEIKQVAGIDTVTIFFGDLRVSTNVMNEDGTRAVGTRVSQEVFDVVLQENRFYPGRAFVVNEWFITRYEPLHDHEGNVVGMLYVGARESAFQALVQSLNNRVTLIALISLILAGIIAFPISRFITQPIAELVQATARLSSGDHSVRVQTVGSGELADLGRSFNSMVEAMTQTQQKLLHQEKLASMGQLAAGVAHEINNPLGTILLFSDVMYKEAEDDDPKREDLRMIIMEATRCKNIVADLLNFSRQQYLLTKETDIHQLLDAVIKQIDQQSSFTQVEILRQYDPHLPTIQADPDQLRQVFVNLLNNAAEAMEAGGTITLSTGKIDDQSVEIKVTDIGCGIPAENFGRLFTPFFTTKPLGRGTGLGLSIAYGIIKMHRGQISVSSEIGVGTTFTILLPTNLPKGALASTIEKSDLIL